MKYLDGRIEKMVGKNVRKQQREEVIREKKTVKEMTGIWHRERKQN